MFKSAIISILALSSTALAAPADATLLKRDGLSCSSTGQYQPISHVIECVKYLQGKGGDACEVKEGEIFCQYGDTIISGANAYLDGQVKSTSCADIASSALKVVDSCTLPNGYVGGSIPALGNPGIIVHVDQIISLPGK